MIEYRITKYDPDYRDGSGAYTRDEWTSVSDIGKAFEGAVLTREEYGRVEDAYVSAAVAFLSEAQVRSLTIDSLENPDGIPLGFANGTVLPVEEAVEVIRRVLREEFWCRLTAAGSFVDVGYDYYMYIGVPKRCPRAEQEARNLGLFVEPFLSPSRNEAD